MNVRPLPAVAVAVMESLYQHRLLSTAQIHTLHTPRASVRWTQRLLHALAGRGLAAYTHGRGPGRLWYLTAAGADAVEIIPTRAETRRRIPTADQAAGQLRAHTLAVNQVAIAFVVAARERDDECGPLSWRHEIAHPIAGAPGRRGGEQLVADALLSYLHTHPDGSVALEQRFIELDRGTIPAHALAAKLARYARLHRHRDPATGVPLWRRHYQAFPNVLVVLADQPRRALEHRRQTMIALCHQYPELHTPPEPRIAFCLLDEIAAEGPFAAIFLTLADPPRWVTWLNHEPNDGRAGSRRR